MSDTTGIDPAIPKSLIASLKETFSVQAQTPIEILQARAAPPGPRKGIAVASVLTMSSPDITGVLALCFPVETYLGVIGKMLGDQFEAIDEANADAAGELLNIIYASARVKINQSGHEFIPAIPTVIHGKEINISHKGKQSIVEIECRCAYGPFFVEVSLAKPGK